MAIVAMLTGLIIMVGVVFGSANTAYAATLTPADERYHVAFPYNDMEYYVGVAGLDASGNKYYCIEAGKLSDYVIGPTTVLASDENARRMAWIDPRIQGSGIQARVSDRLFGRALAVWFAGNGGCAGRGTPAYVCGHHPS